MDDQRANSNPPWWRDAGLRKLNFFLLSCYLGAISNGYGSSLITNLIADPRWFQDISGVDNSKLLGLVTAALSLGGIAAFFPAPLVSERFGRRAGITFGIVCTMGGLVGQIFCRSFDQFLATRLAIGFGSTINTVSSSALLIELAHPRQRAILGAMLNTCWFLGSTIAAWTSYGALHIRASWSWRLPVAVQLSWAVIQLGLLFFCPESPRWLVRNNMPEMAKRILTEYHSNGRVNDPLVEVELSTMLLTKDIPRSQSSWSALYATSGNRKRLLLSVVIGIATQWVGNGIITFYLPPVLQTVGIESTHHQQGINGGLQIYSWLLALCAALLAEKAGRRRLLLLSACTMLLFMVLVTACSAVYVSTRSVAAGYAVVVFLFLFLGGYVIGLTPIPVLYVNEVWPGHLRTKGSSVFWVVQAIAVCFNQFVNPVALGKIGWKYYLVYVGVLVFFITFVFLFVPETKRLSLQEIEILFDDRFPGRDSPGTDDICVIPGNTHLCGIAGGVGLISVLPHTDAV